MWKHGTEGSSGVKRALARLFITGVEYGLWGFSGFLKPGIQGLLAAGKIQGFRGLVGFRDLGFKGLQGCRVQHQSVVSSLLVGRRLSL